MRRSRRAVGASVAAAALVAGVVALLPSGGAQAAQFTGGDLVVYRVGTGTAPLSNAAAATFLDEFSPTGSKVQSVALPTAAADGNHVLTATGLSRSEGLISRSADGRFVAATGYDAAPGATGAGGSSLTTTDPTAVGRTVGLVDANGTVDTSTVLKTSTTAQIIRSAASTDGDRLYAAGGNGGIVTTTLGSTNRTVVAGGSANLAGLSVQGGQLFTSGLLGNRLATVGSGAPTATTTATDVPGLPDNLLTYGYALLDLTSKGYGGTALDTLYLSNASERGGTVDKYSYDGSTWTRDGFVDVPGAFGLVADRSGSDVTLAVTTPTKLLLLKDTGAAGTSFTPAAPTTLATATTNTEFRGVSLAPTGSGGPSVFVRSPATGSSVDLGGNGVPFSALITGPAGISSVKVALNGGTPVSAVKDSGNVWSATVPFAGAAAGPATLTVTATSAGTSPKTTTVTRVITLTAASVPTGDAGPGIYAFTNPLVKRTGTWTAYTASGSPSGRGLQTSVKGRALTVKVYGRSTILTFRAAKNEGIATITVDGTKSSLNLYSKTTKALTSTYSFGSGPVTEHTVVVTVSGTKSAASSGTYVFASHFEVK